MEDKENVIKINVICFIATFHDYMESVKVKNSKVHLPLFSDHEEGKNSGVESIYILFTVVKF